MDTCPACLRAKSLLHENLFATLFCKIVFADCSCLRLELKAPYWLDTTLSEREREDKRFQQCTLYTWIYDLFIHTFRLTSHFLSHAQGAAEDPPKSESHRVKHRPGGAALEVWNATRSPRPLGPGPVL